jgi:hypothetical protein
MIDEIRAALDPVADAFEALGVSYRVGGSVASSALGVARTTLDVDLVADLRAAHVTPLVERLQADRERSFPLTTPEDIVIHKLDWYRLGGGTSERQWADVLGVLKLQGDALDRMHLAHWAKELGIIDLLERALAEAGLG